MGERERERERQTEKMSSDGQRFPISFFLPELCLAWVEIGGVVTMRDMAKRMGNSIQHWAPLFSLYQEKMETN